MCVQLTNSTLEFDHDVIKIVMKKNKTKIKKKTYYTNRDVAMFYEVGGRRLTRAIEANILTYNLLENLHIDRKMGGRSHRPFGRYGTEKGRVGYVL